MKVKPNSPAAQILTKKPAYVYHTTYNFVKKKSYCTYMCIHIYMYIHKYTHIQPVYTYMVPAIHTYIHTYIHTVHTYMHTYIHTYIHTCIQTVHNLCKFISVLVVVAWMEYVL